MGSWLVRVQLLMSPAMWKILKRHVDEKNKAVSVFVDCSKAFDVIDQDKFLAKLSNIGFSLEVFVTNRLLVAWVVESSMLY